MTNPALDFVELLNAGVQDHRTGLLWAKANNALELTLAAAHAYCQSYAGYGYTDWRLPTMAELFEIADHTRAGNATIPLIATSPSGNYWSATASTAWTGQFYKFFSELGGSGAAAQEGTAGSAARCVRRFGPPAGPILPASGRYLVAADTALDQVTGLHWQRGGSPATLGWSAAATPSTAQDYCGTLKLGGYTDWRVPTLAELAGLLQRHGEATLLIDAVAFPQTTSGNYWSATPTVATPGYPAWYVNFAQGYIGYYFQGTASYDVRCVRGP